MSMELLFVTMFVVLVAIAAALAYGTIAKTRWGVNFRRLRCPRCDTPAPLVRTPKSARQAMWGGVTCAKCGCEIDKWGREISA